MNSIFEVSDTEDCGVMLRVRDLEVADELDDFLSEECYVFFEQKFESDHVDLFFGQASSPERIEKILQRFRLHQESHL